MTIEKLKQRSINIYTEALDKVITDFEIDNDDFRNVNLQAAYDNLDLEHDSKHDDGTLFAIYYEWFSRYELKWY